MTCIRRVPTNFAVAAGRADRQDVAAGIDVVGAVVEVPGRPAVLRNQETDAWCAGVALAGGGDDNRLVGIVVARKYGDAADVDAGGRAKFGERNPGRTVGAVVRKSVVFQMPPLAPAAYTVFPEGSEGSMASPVTRPDGSAPAARAARSTPGRPLSTPGSKGHRSG